MSCPSGAIPVVVVGDVSGAMPVYIVGGDGSMGGAAPENVQVAHFAFDSASPITVASLPAGSYFGHSSFHDHERCDGRRRDDSGGERYVRADDDHLLRKCTYGAARPLDFPHGRFGACLAVERPCGILFCSNRALYLLVGQPVTKRRQSSTSACVHTSDVGAGFMTPGSS